MTLPPPLEQWFNARGWSPFGFQREAWEAFAAGRSGLIHAPTGTGKTLAALLGPVADWMREHPDGSDDTPPHRLVWITPMRALASDTLVSIREPIADLGLPWTAEKRTGDTSSSVKARQRKKLPTVLVTTPESLTILLSYADSAALFRNLRAAVVDEWHELVGTKRGVQTELALARLRSISPELRTWGLSATLGNSEEAARALIGAGADEPTLIRGLAPKSIEIESLIPGEIERYPWAGHLGITLIDDVIERVEAAGVTLLFTNTRSQAEIWFREMLRRRPDLVGQVALHHGSIDRELRQRVEAELRDRAGRLRCVVCTSSLDLGVDFSPVDQVIQVGSPKGVARLVQRAGRSGHQPGAVSRVLCVPSHALELVEFAGARDLVESKHVEHRPPLAKPLDVLSQHLVTMAMGGGFDEGDLRTEIETTNAYHAITDDEWSWTMDFVRSGGATLGAYPDYARIADDGGLWKVPSRKIATRHRMGIGSIVADAAVAVRFSNGHTLGSIEESFITRLRKGERFVFAGRVLELVRLYQMTATVRKATGRKGTVPRWQGGKMPLSTQLADAVRARLGEASAGRFDGPELAALQPLLERQRDLSVIPRPDQLLIETVSLRNGHHAFLFPFGGRLAHEGLGAVLSLRLSRLRPATVTAVVNDYGIELVTDDPVDLAEPEWRELLSPEGLVEDMAASVNESEMARRQFREIARIAGLTHQGYPGRASPARHLQASSDMFYEVFEQFDPDNLLLDQARREVIEGQLEVKRLRETLEACAGREIVLRAPERVTPLAFPLFAESLRATTVSTETWEDRVRKMAVRMDAPAKESAR